MRLPENPKTRREAFVEVGRQCAVDRPERKPYHADLRQWFTRGRGDGDRAVYNKIQSHVRQSAAYLFQSESVRFGPVLPPRYGETFNLPLDAFRDEVHRWWHDSRAGLTVATGVEWSHVYPTVVFKVVPSAGVPHVHLVPDPADIGVLEPDRPFDRQEAKIHFYWLTISKFRRLVEGHTKERELLELAVAEAAIGTEDTGPATTLESIVFDNSGSPLEGGGVPVASALEPRAHVEVPRVLMAELWVVDDRIRDYRVATCLAAGGEIHTVLFERRTTILSGVDPFVALTLQTTPDYTWGLSIVDDLTGLQQERDEYKEDIRRLFKLQMDAPILISGWGGLKSDRAERLRQPRAVIATGNMNVKVERLAPNAPPEMLAMVEGTDKEFADSGGLPILLQGQGEPGVRAGNQVGVMATLASARIRENAMRVEYAASEIATLGALLMREMNDEPLTMTDGTRCLLSQIPRDVVFEVISHSASPLYAAAVGDKFDRMLKAGAITRPSYVRGLDPPGAEILAAEARRLEEAAGKRQAKLLELAELKALHGRGGSR